ncbi:hypothetical protein GCM10009527_082680 [Actinomadura nitritigenes]|uniref:Ribonuclease n=1 Tax=Actinomadura nitritigenes TaxID=134602 RepID=A0ABS3QSS1_9ACTN|nr:ribonuclease domain-containing protein [Actinomadura nitritigenes]MBO2436672.1 ribonuclease [Actinomadura nitritigenes]
MTTPRHRFRRALLPAALLIAGLTGPAAHAATAPAAQPATVSAAYAAAPGPSVHAVSTVCESALPSQADDTIALIDKGGPFPYPQDGTVFQNREGLLPQEPQGYYHEYTVKTPGSSTRGARRIITSDDLGHDGMYWTPDHYSTFYDIDFGC